MIVPWVYFLKEDEQLVIESLTAIRTVEGPGACFTRPLERAWWRKGITLTPLDILRIRNTVSGEIRVETGPRLVFLGPHDEVLQELSALSLGPTSYARVCDTTTGVLRNVLGPRLFFPGPHDQVVEQLEAITLKQNQYVRIIDKETGIIRVERGESRIYLGPTEQILEPVTTGVNLDGETAVLVRDLVDGQLSLITQQQVFIPGPRQEITEVRPLIRLEDHEVVVIKNEEGSYQFRRGQGPDRSFFLPPYWELVQFWWSSGLHKDKRSLVITRIDTRPKFMWYEFEVRTRDNVELVLGVTFFWQIMDVEKMVQTTDDIPGDICSHARSAIIQSVSQMTLEQFLASFNAAVRNAVLEPGDSFYTDRGTVIHAVEVRSVACKDEETQHILNEIIQETTNRLNRLQKQESENEIKLAHLRGEIEAEQMAGDLLALQREHTRLRALTEGEAESEKVRALFEGLAGAVPPDERAVIFQTLRKQDMLAALSQGSAHLYFTPAEVELAIETRGGTAAVRR